MNLIFWWTPYKTSPITHLRHFNHPSKSNSARKPQKKSFQSNFFFLPRQNKNSETWYDLLFAAWAFSFMALHFSRRDDCFRFRKIYFLFTFSLLQNDENGARRKVKMSSNVMSDCAKTALKGAEKLRNPRRCSVTKCVVKSFLLLCLCWDPSIPLLFLTFFICLVRCFFLARRWRETFLVVCSKFSPPPSSP